jgi:hypothetical protein
MGYFQPSQPDYHKTTNIFKDTNINTIFRSSNVIFCHKKKRSKNKELTGRTFKIKFRTYKNMRGPDSFST